MRRFRNRLCLFLSLLLILPAFFPSRGSAASVEELVKGMSLRDKLSQMMVLTITGWESETTPADRQKKQTIPLTLMNSPLRSFLRDWHIGGVLLYDLNIRTAEQTLQLTLDIQKANHQYSPVPLLFAADQEGGSVSRLNFGTAGPGNMALAATGNTDTVRKMAAVHASELAALGIQADLAPVADVNSRPGDPVIGVRAFSDDPALAASMAVAFLRGLHEKNVIATLKHFPGYGNAVTDGSAGFPVADRTLEEMKKSELVPFQAAIQEGADMIMTAHVQYPQLEKGTCVSASTGEKICLPATMSPAILQDILRKEMGFQGVIVSGSLDADVIRKNIAGSDLLPLLINAGVNMILLPGITGPSDMEKIRKMLDEAVRLAEKGIISRDRIDESVGRILLLKKKYGILDQTSFEMNDEKRHTLKSIGSRENLGVAWRAAADGLTILKNENRTLPFQVSERSEVLILFSDSCANRAATAELAVSAMKKAGKLPERLTVRTMVHSRGNTEECLEAARQASHVLLIYRTYNLDCLNPRTQDGFSSEAFDTVMETIHREGRTVALISCQLPYDAARFPEADAIMLCYGSSPMRELPQETGPDSAFMPNLPAAICAVFGAENAGGKLPVSIPALDLTTFRLRNDILYARQVR